MIIKDHISFHKMLPSQGKLLSIDVGTKRLGIAICDESRLIVTPKRIIERKSNEKDFHEIKKMIEENQVIAIVIGLPINMDGTLNDMSRFSEKFANDFDKFLDEKMKIFFADERLSSFEAKLIALELRSRKKQKHHDDIAATIILQDFLDLVNSQI